MSDPFNHNTIWLRIFAVFYTSFLLAPVPKLFPQEILKLAITTSTHDTGLLDYILPPFEKQHNLKVHLLSVGSGKAIKLGENGDVDMILVHARRAEDKFISEGFGVNRRDVMSNDFIIAGPENDPADIKGLNDPLEVLRKIYISKQIFVSRGDDSGTHMKEKALWKGAGLEPAARGNFWFLETGQGQGASLRIADEKNGYILLDRGTYLFNKKNIRLKILFEGGEKLLNPYSIIAVSPYKHDHVLYERAMALIAWMTSPECQEMINNYKVNGYKLFYKNAANSGRH